MADKNINWYPGHMARSLRQMRSMLAQVDLVLETCDARIPWSSRNPELAGLTRDKPLLIVLNKADLADPAVTKQWLDYWQEEGKTALACNSTRRTGLDRLKKTALDLCRDKIEAAKARGRVFRPVRILVAGIPNTGKSTLINALSNRKSAQVADRPGITRQLSWIRAGQLELLDSPGVLWPKLDDGKTQLYLAATGAIRDDILPVEEIAASLLPLLARFYPDRVTERYRISQEAAQAPQGLHEAAINRGCLLPGGRPDLNRFALLLMDELRKGRLGRISLERPQSQKKGAG